MQMRRLFAESLWANIALWEQEVWSRTMCLPTQWYMETLRECVDGYAPVAQNWTMHYSVPRVELRIAGAAKSSSESEDISHKSAYLEPDSLRRGKL